MRRFLILAALAAPCLGKDCWEWTTLDVEGPGPWAYPSCYYDSERGALVFSGGDHQDVWTWNGSQWAKLDTEPAGDGACWSEKPKAFIAYDDERDIGVSIRGSHEACEYNEPAEMSRCRGGNREAIFAPPCAGRSESATCFVPTIKKFVMFGGAQWFHDGGWIVSTDGWTFDGEDTWENDITSGPAMYCHAIGYLPDTDQIVAYGGFWTEDKPNTQTRILTRYECPGPGDLNCDVLVNFDDIDPFVLAITDGKKYGERYPDCDRSLADVNADGSTDFGDIDPFVELLIK